MNSEQEKLIKETRKILNYGFAKMQSVDINLNNVKKKKFILFLSMGAIQSYTEAIIKLVTPPSVYDIAAESLFRAIAECYININYIYASRSDLHALIFLVNSITDRIRFANKHKAFMINHPSWNITFGTMKNPNDWDIFINNKKNEIVKTEKRFRKQLPKKMPTLEDRVKAIDANLEKLGKLKPDNSAESYYVHFYGFFSQPSHLNIDGLERFFKIDKQGSPKLLIDGNEEGTIRILSITYQIYFVVLRHFLQVFKIYNYEEFKEFNKFSKSLGKKK